MKDDRHVLAAAIRSHSNAIVTFNLKDFPQSALSLCRPTTSMLNTPDEFLHHQLGLDSDIREERRGFALRLASSLRRGQWAQQLHRLDPEDGRELRDEVETRGRLAALDPGHVAARNARLPGQRFLRETLSPAQPHNIGGEDVAYVHPRHELDCELLTTAQ